MPSSVNGSPASPAQKIVVALHGFLGRPQDWSLIPNLLPADWQLLAIDVLQQTSALGASSFATSVDELIHALKREVPADACGVLLGYSMGGRLAMQILAKAPELFAGAVIVSANPGLKTESERASRRAADEAWARKFDRPTASGTGVAVSMEWTRLIAEWNAQSVLKTPPNAGPDAISLDRHEADFHRERLARAMRVWSLAEQPNLRADLAPLAVPILFVTGREDAKFTALTTELTTELFEDSPKLASGSREHAIIDRAGHRVPWDAPIQFRSILAKFLARW